MPAPSVEWEVFIAKMGTSKTGDQVLVSAFAHSPEGPVAPVCIDVWITRRCGEELDEILEQTFSLAEEDRAFEIASQLAAGLDCGLTCL